MLFVLVHVKHRIRLSTVQREMSETQKRQRQLGVPGKRGTWSGLPHEPLYGWLKQQCLSRVVNFCGGRCFLYFTSSSSQSRPLFPVCLVHPRQARYTFSLAVDVRWIYQLKSVRLRDVNDLFDVLLCLLESPWHCFHLF